MSFFPQYDHQFNQLSVYGVLKTCCSLMSMYFVLKYKDLTGSTLGVPYSEPLTSKMECLPLEYHFLETLILTCMTGF